MEGKSGVDDLFVEGEILFEDDVNRHDVSCLPVDVFVEQVADQGLDCVEALQLRPLAEQRGDISFFESLDVPLGKVE